MLDGRYRSRHRHGAGHPRRPPAERPVRDPLEPRDGTTVALRQAAPAQGRARHRASPARGSAASSRWPPCRDPNVEIRAQNQELLRALEESAERQVEVERLNQELAETNRGVLALYAELDEKAADLARASELKSRFLSNISHELRTPLNAILNITRLLQDRVDGPLTEDQDRQVRFVRPAATTLSEMVNDLLDLARIEAGRTRRPARRRSPRSTCSRRCAACSARWRRRTTVAIVLDDPVDLPPLFTDEGKLSQILRNFIGNAVKFTEPGEIRVRAAADGDGRVDVRRHRHRHRHRAGGPGEDLRGVLAARQRAPAQGHRRRARPAALAQAGRAAGRTTWRSRARSAWARRSA